PSPSAPSESTQDADPQQPAGDGPYGTQITTGTTEVALTFDDGPDPRYTPQALAVLREHQIKATFCVVGQNARNHPELIRAIVADGHTLCNHSWNHDTLLGKRSPDVIRADLIRTSQAIRAAAPDAPVVWFRQPGGAWTDWRAPGAQRIATVLSTYVGPGAVVLLHDAGGNRQGTIDALRYVLPELTGRYHFDALPTGAT
ncbi:polysaccharide deacetylase family protein, partial [Micromonospora fluostatini]